MATANSMNDTLDFFVGDPADGLPTPASAQISLDWGGLSHQGKVRPSNQDHFLCVRFGRFLEALLTNLPPERRPSPFAEEGYGAVVADGMGGARGGEIASQMAIYLLISLVLNTPDWILSTQTPDAENVLRRMSERYRLIDALLADQGAGDPKLRGMGTTMTLAVLFGTQMLLAHVGDSRAYLLRGGELHQLTRDHTMAQELLASGALHTEEAASSRLRHSLTRVVGGHGGLADAQVQRLVLAHGDHILLCTDGLTNMVADADIQSILLAADSAAAASQKLIDQALAHGGRDNVTAVVARFQKEGA